VVAFESMASNLVSGDSNGMTDVFVHGAQLQQVVEPPVASAGDTVTITCREAPAGNRGLMFVTLLGGAQNYVLWMIGSFAADRQWITTHTLPPGLTGFDFGFVTFALGDYGRVQDSNLAPLQIR
jgi:hypothetical protein